MQKQITELRPWVEDLRKGTWACVDTETTGLNVHTTDKPFAVGIRDYKDEVMTWEWVVDIYTREPEVPLDEANDLATTLMCYDWIVMHNSLFDVAALKQIGIEVPWGRVHDTMILAHLLDSNDSKGLKPLSLHHFDYDTADEDALLLYAKLAVEIAKENGFPVEGSPKAHYWLPSALKAKGIEVPGFDSCHEYLEGDVERTALLWQLFREQIMQNKMLPQYHRDMSVLPMYELMSKRGMKVSFAIGSIVTKWENETGNLKEVLETKAGISNLDSADELRQAVYGKWKLKPAGFTPKGVPSVDKEAMTKLAEKRTTHREFFVSLLNYRTQKTALKYVHSYLRLTDGEGCLHPGINPTGTHTTRTSSSAPNGQNVAKSTDFPTRRFFVPREGYELWAMDYNQLEVRLFALASGDETLKEELSQEGGDVHQKTADIFGIERRIAKNINFAWLYGAGKQKMGAMAGVSAEEFIAGMRGTYPEAVAFMAKQDRAGRRNGCVKTLFGTRLWVDQGRTYSATNYTIQGSAGDVMKIGLIRVWDYLERNGLNHCIHPLILVHDELVFEVDDGLGLGHLERIKQCLEYPGVMLDWPLPVDAEKSKKSWGEMEEVKW